MLKIDWQYIFNKTHTILTAMVYELSPHSSQLEKITKQQTIASTLSSNAIIN